MKSTACFLTFTSAAEARGRGFLVVSSTMLAMARILRTGARLLLLDEITEGLAPVIVQKLGEVLIQLKERGMTIVLVEQNFRFAAPLADRHFVMDHGQIVEEISAEQLPARRLPSQHHAGGITPI